MKKQLWLYGLLFMHLCAWSQENQPAEELYSRARAEAFDHKAYKKAIELMVLANQKAPENVDYQIFLGRLYTWDQQTEKARTILKTTFGDNPTYDDAALAYGSLVFWDKKPSKALEIVDKGLETNVDSESLWVLKAKILMELKENQRASATLTDALKHHPKSTVVRSLLQNMGTGTYRNEVGVDYSFVHFKEQFNEPWHIASLNYQHQTNIGPLIGRLSYGNRFGMGSSQFELDFYPRLSNTFYAYMNAGISNDKGVFPEYRAGFSLYANLPAAFELDAGLRYLQFTDDSWIYTFGLGKYYKNYWFNARAYITPSDNGVADSYALEARYYFGGPDDHVLLRAGTGFSPDNSANNVLYESTSRLRSNNITAGFRKLLGKSNVVYSELTYGRIEFTSDSKDDQYTIKVGYIKRF
ncbi:YaiO family outer membrane beta-barrel protein [Flagellimonas amoyensis]|uniref:YaiO family outer membrane beta-barrel protein n=1 Tax=Flagellimonas amoyensis TaxID=2169401 RepID=UPI00131F35D2|nr:YaiO family outer membrane beta-barrel protein [Allomuricauda amoyensis]